MRVPITKNVDPGALADQLSTALGKPVAVSIRNPGQKDNKGDSLPGVVVLIDPATGEELPDQDSGKIAAVLAAHVVSPPAKTPARTLADALGSANSLVELKVALAGFAGALVDREDKAKQRRPRGRG